MKKHRVFSLFTVIFVAFLLCRAVTIVPTGYTGVKTSFGQIQETTIQSGKLNFTVPFVQSIHTVNNKQQDKHIEAQIWGEASDKTPVYAADVIVTYQVLPEKSAWLYANVSDTKNLVGDELVASAIKSAMAELGPNEVTNRIKIEPLAQQKLAESLNQKYGEDAVFINKVVINDMDFEEAYNTAIQQKSIARQNADKQKIENEAAIAKAEADKQVAITKAEAEAQKTSIAADAQAEANRKIAESLSDTLISTRRSRNGMASCPPSAAAMHWSASTRQSKQVHEPRAVRRLCPFYMKWRIKTMAVTKKIEIDGQMVEFRASAAVPRLYRIKFGRDIYKDLRSLEKSVDDGNEESSSLDLFSLEMFENIAFIMAKHAHPDQVPDNPDEWLENFNTFSIYQILPQLIELWGLNVQTEVEARKNLAKVSG